MMETFCTEPLEIGSNTITFSPETKKHRPPKLLNISFLNAPPETLEDILTEFVNEYADIKGFPFYPKKVHDGISYCTGTRVYQVSKLHQHIPRKIYNMFGRTVIGIYNNQPKTTQDHGDQNIPQMKHTLIMTQTQLKLKLTQKAKMKQKTKLKHKTSLKTNHKRT